ncbi:hypothetical protein MTO96_025664 [Rhipicephalus appendiculatus]
MVISHVLKKTAEAGFDVVRLVTDNHKINVAAMDIMCNGEANIRAPHPADSSKEIYLSFDQSHVIKNVRSQFLAKDFGKNKQVSSKYVKELYRMQKHSTMRPVRFLTRKHVYPSNVEKMSVRLAVQLFSVAVTAALSYLKDQAGHTCDLDFASAGPTIEFMKMMQKWFTLMDVSNFQQYIHCNNEDTRPFTDVEDPRLEWLETVFLGYIEDLKNESSAGNFFSKETYHALVFATKSNVDCIRHVLTVQHFKFVLTRKMSSDPIESLFGFLRRSSGCNDMLDVKSAVCGLEKMLKTGIVAASKESNVQSSTSFASRQLLPSQQSPTTNSGGNGGRLYCSSCERECLLRKLYRTAARAQSHALLGLIAHQDRGGLLYPSQELLKLLVGLRKFVDCVLAHRRCITKPLEVCVKRSVELLAVLPVLSCGNADIAHRKQLFELISKKFMKPMLSNYALSATERNASVRILENKPLSRKVLTQFDSLPVRVYVAICVHEPDFLNIHI